MSSRKKVIPLFLVVYFCSKILFGQSQGNTPYSQFNYGELADQTVAAQDMMGGIGVSSSNGFYINNLNPAFLVKNKTIGFSKYVSFSAGLKGNLRTITQNDIVQQGFGMNLNHLSLAFPIQKWYAMGVSLRPYSIVSSHSIYKHKINGSDEDIIEDVEGKGGITRISWVNSFNPVKGLYLGLESDYNAGSFNRDTTIQLPSVSYNATKIINRFNLNRISFKLGAAYQIQLKKDWKLNLGGTYAFKTALKGQQLSTIGNYGDIGNGLQLLAPQDTLYNSTAAADLPEQYKVGISIEKPFNFLFGVDYGVTKWKDANLLIASERDIYQYDAQELNVGTEWMPNSASTKYFNQVYYRLGYKRVADTYQIFGKRIYDNSFSFGMSLPLGYHSPSYIDVAVAFGSRGGTAANQIRENYLRISVNFSLMNAWFREPRID